MLRNARNLIIGLLLLILGGTVGYKVGQSGQPLTLGNIQSQIIQSKNPPQYQNVSMDTFWEVWGILQQNYLRTEGLDANKMVDGAISGMTAALGDPYTVYLPPADDKRVSQDLAGSFSGVGIELGYSKDNILSVVAPLSGSPADKAGVKAGDLILHVSDKAKNLDSDTNGWSLDDAVDKIRGPQGTPVILTLLRMNDNGNKPFQVTLNRDEIVVKSAEVSFVDHNNKKVAVIKLSRFGERTQQEWDDVVKQILATPNVSGIVLDMRNNPGGLFDEAINIASDFVPNGVVVKQRGKFSTQDFKANGNPRLSKYPVVVVVNKGSASAAEIVAGALKDDLNAKLYGETSFGKGTVQDRKELANGGGLHVTIAEWLLPKGESIHGKGIPVDVPVTDDPKTPDDEVLQKAISAF